jgi:hypothetical protein
LVTALSCRTEAARDAEFAPRAHPGGYPVTSPPVLSGTARGVRIAGVLAAGAAVLSMGAAGCTTVTGGDPAVNAGEAPAYRTSVSLSSSQSAASSSARESERQASMTTQAVLATCETLATSSAEAIDAVNDYVDAFNAEVADVANTEGPAIDALIQSADAVETSISDIVPGELADAFLGWVAGALNTAEAITNQAPPSEFNAVIAELNDARANALDLCDVMYR